MAYSVNASHWTASGIAILGAVGFFATGHTIIALLLVVVAVIMETA